jgi:lia operon protein LiaF
MEESQMNHLFNKMIFGLGMIAIGVLYLLNQLNLTQFDLGYLFSTYWPVFIIYFGLRGLFIPNRGGSMIWSFFVIFLGVYFLLNNLGVDAFSYDNMYKFILPVLLILFGFNVLFKGTQANINREELRREKRRERESLRQEQREMKRQKRHNYHSEKEQYKEPYTMPVSAPLTGAEAQPIHPPRESDWKWTNYSHNPAPGKTQRSSFIGDIHFGQEDWQLTPLDISLFIGDTVIDLTRANIPTGETRINVSSFIGDLKIFIPNDMQLEVSVTASAFISDMKVLDRYESGLFKNVQTQTRDYNDGEKKILIMVNTFIGDVIVKRVG